MSTKYKFNDQNKLYFITYSVINWIDVFIRNEYKDILLQSWEYCIREKGLEVYAWCIMSSHVHMIIGSNKNKLEDIIRDMKRHTSTKMRDVIKDSPIESRKDWLLKMMEYEGRRNKLNNDFQFWQQDNHPIELFDSRVMIQKLNYIHNNPVAAGFVSEPQHWLYSSALDYCGEKGLLEGIILL
jgi:REP element-mobilizing transposase RayT